MQFDRFSVALLILRPDAPHLDEADEAALQDAHMAHLAHLHASGTLLAAGPLLIALPHLSGAGLLDRLTDGVHRITAAGSEAK